MDVTLRKRPLSVGGRSQPVWLYDRDVDLAHHVTRRALVQPGGATELSEMLSWWYSSRLARDRPMRDSSVVEGQRDGSLALLTRMHHAVTDGVAGQHVLHRQLSLSLLSVRIETLVHRLVGVSTVWDDLVRCRSSIRSDVSERSFLAAFVLNITWNPHITCGLGEY
ncbi:wax ester/triacylglycerol synthase domain-containing protein [Nocardia wallacei]|uniref:wax ester/triacylglycerol synthase domain-containing protein n=1 Tax=Nocardia wallacei TaxID=480035 RepID=UPI003CC7D410